MGSQEPMPPENGSSLLQPRDWSCSMSSDDGAISASQIHNMELDGEWFGDADPAVVLQAKESPAMILLLSIANAAADVIPGLSHAPMPWDGPLPRRGLHARDGAHSSQPISNQDAGSSSSSSSGYYRLPWYRRPLRSPQFAAAQAAEFPAQGSGRSNFPPLFGVSPRSDISTRFEAAAAAFGESSTHATPETRIFVPAAYMLSGAADVGEGRAAEVVRGQRDGGDDELRGDRGSLRGAEAVEASGLEVIDAESGRQSVVLTTPSQGPTEDEDRRESRSVDISPIQLTVEAAPTPPRVPRDEDSEGSPVRAFLPPGVGVPEAPMEEAPPAPVSSPVNPQPVKAELENTPGSAEEHKIRELKAEVNRLKREMAAMAAGFAGKMTYRSAKAESMERSPPPQDASRGEKSGTPPWQCGAASAAAAIGGGGGRAADDMRDPSKLSKEVTSTVVTSPSSTQLESTRLRADDFWDQRRRDGNKGNRGNVEGHPRPRGGDEVGGIGGTAVFRMEDEGRMRRVTVASVLPTPASSGGVHEGGRDSVPGPDVRVCGGEQDANSTPEFNRIPPVVANVMLSPPVRRRSSSLGLGPSPASGEKTIGGGGGSGGGVGDVRVQDDRRETVEPDIANLASRRPVGGSDRGADVGGGGTGGGVRGNRPSSTSSSDGRVRDDERGGPDHVPIDGNITVRPSIFFPVQDRAAEGPRSRANEILGGSASAKQAPEPSKPPASAAPTSAAPASGPSQTPPRGAGDSAEGHAPGSSGKSKSRPSSRRRDLVTDNTLWRWVLAQRTENPTVRQALISHGLPPLSRRRVWAAWAGVAKPIPPPQAPSHKRKGPAEASLTSVSNIISHDVQRTKILHPLFSGNSQAIPILKRVLLRCAQIGAVKDAGYIQGMNFLAGFLIINCADSIVAERGDESPVTPVSGKRTEGGGSKAMRHQSEPRGTTVSSSAGGAGGRGVKSRDRGKKERVVELTDEEAEVVEAECVDVMLGLVALQGGVLSRDLCGLHSNTELVEELLSRHCPPIMEHLRSLSLELIVLTPRWFICIYAASIASQSVVARIWDLYLWHGRRGPAVLVWVALGILHGCRRRLLESEALPTAVSAVRRFAEGCKSFADLVRQAPVGLNQVVTAWEEHGDNRKILALDGEGPIPDAVVGYLVREMTGEMVSLPLPPDATSPRGFRDSNGFPGGGGSGGGAGGGGNSFVGQFPSTPGRLPTPLTSPRSPFPQWAANIFRSSTGGLMDTEGYGEQRDSKEKVGSPRADGAHGRWGDGGMAGPPGTSLASSGGRQPYRRTSANSSSSWW